MNKITLSKIKSSKFSLLVISFIATIINLVVAITLISNGFKLSYYIFPIIIGIVNIGYFIYAYLVNFRFRYTLLPSLLYILIMILSAIPIIYNTFIFKGKFISNEITFFWIIAHISILVCLLISFIKSKKQPTNKYRLWSLGVSMALIFITCIEVIFVINNGIFGQGTNKKTIIYEENTDGTYSIVDVIVDYNDTIIVKDNFNNKKISSFNCELFKRNDINNIIFDREENINFYNYILDNEINSDLNIKANQSIMNNVKNSLYKTNSVSMIDIANKVLPNDLDSDEVFINFTYDLETLELIDKTIPLWIGNSGDTFNYAKYSSDFDWINHIDCNNFKDLNWNYDNNGYILSSTTIDKQIINSSILSYKIEFAKIYKLVINEDNDTKFEVEDKYKYSYIDGEEYDYKLGTLEQIENIINEYPTREGFELKFYSADKIITNISNYILESSVSEISVDPIWTMKRPVITKLESNSINNNFIYGDLIKLETEVNSLSEDILYEYIWLVDGKEIEKSSNNFLELIGLTPADSNKYNLEVRAYSLNSSLETKSFADIAVTINKKELVFSWNLPVDDIYNGENKIITVAYDKLDLVGDDKISYSLFLDNDNKNLEISVIDASIYAMSIELDEESNKLYYISENTKHKNYEIKKRNITLVWNEESLTHVYDGNEYRPTIDTINNVIDSDKGLLNSSLIFSESNKDVNKYNLTVSLENKNYEIVNPIIEYSIIPKEITILWDDSNNHFTYDGNYHVPSYSNILGVIDIDKANISNYITLTGEQKNYSPEPYTCTAIINNNNYSIINPDFNFNILKKNITVQAGNVTTIYGEDKVMTYNFEALVGNDKFTGELVKEEGNDIGEYKIKIGTLSAGDNYQINFIEGIYKIEPKVIEIIWSEDNFTYNGLNQKESVTAYYLDINNEEVNLKVNLNDFINYGSYTASVEFVNGETNYVLPVSTNKNYNMKQAINSYEIEFNQSGFTYGDNPPAVTMPIPKFGTASVRYYLDNEYENEISNLTNNSNAGTYYVKVSVLGNENYSSLDSSYEVIINKKEVEITWSNDEFYYTGLEQIVTATYDDILGNKINLLVNLDNKFIEAGSYTASASFANAELNYALPSNVTKTYEIKVADNYWINEYIRNGWTYGDMPSPVLVNPNSKFGDVTIKYYKDSACKEEMVEDFNYDTNSGTYYASVTVLETSNYKGLKSIYEFVIYKKQIESILWSENNYRYTGSEHKVEAKFNNILGSLTDLEVWINDKFINVGTYTATAFLKSTEVNNYEIICTTEKDYSIEIGQAYWYQEFSLTSYTYGETPYFEYPAYSLTAFAEKRYGTANIRFYKEIECINSVVLNSSTPVGTYYAKAYVDDTPNYLGITKVYIINVLPKEVTITIDDKNSYYLEELKELTYHTNISSNNDLLIVLTKEEGNDVGDYVISGVCQNQNYNATIINGTYTIMQGITTIKDLDIDINTLTPSANSNYGEIIFTYSNEYDGEYTTTKPIDAGIYYLKASVSGTKNYTNASEIIQFEIIGD